LTCFGNFGDICQEIKMPKDKKEKKSKVVETVEDVEMKDASPKVCFGVEWSHVSG